MSPDYRYIRTTLAKAMADLSLISMLLENTDYSAEAEIEYIVFEVSELYKELKGAN